MPMNKRLWTAMAALLLSAPAQAVSGEDFQALAGFIEKTKAETHLPSGTAVAVVQDGRLVYEGYFGYADIAGQKPVTRDTAFYIASATKPFLALNTLLLENAGRLDTKTDLQTLFPALRFQGFDARAVTVKDLLVHTSGLDNQPLVWATAFSGVHDAGSRLGLVAGTYADPESALGQFNYTNVGYNILSVWLDREFRQPWQKQLTENVFSPLGMAHTSASISEARAKHWPLAKPYSVQSVQRRAPLYLEKSDDTMQAAGGMVSTAPDLAKFLMAQLDEGRLGTIQALPAAVIAESQRPQAKTEAKYLDFQRTGYAWGWYTGEYKGKNLLHHFGSYAGFHAHLSFIPEANAGLVILNNEDFLSSQLSNLIADYSYGVLLAEPGIASRLAGRFDALLAKARGLDQAVAQQQAKLQGRAWALSLPREAYAGTYSHELLGDMSVQLDGQNNLVFRWGRLRAVATAYEQPEQVRVEFAPNSGEVLAFALKDGKVEAIQFDRMRFRKVR